METIDSSPPSPNSRKRVASQDQDSPQKKPLNLKGTQFVMPTPPDTDQSSSASPKCNEDVAAREASPAPSISTLSSVEIVSSNPVENSTTPGSSTTSAASRSGPPPAKKRKLTPAEKEQQKKDKEAKAAEKAAEKARKDIEKAQKDAEKAEEKARKDEDKRIKDEEKRKKAEEREAKKRDKELEEERKSQEKLKKERAQMRLGIFFQKPATPVKQDADGGAIGSARRKSLSLEPFDAIADQIRKSESPCKGGQQSAPDQEQTPAKPSVSDYHKYFLPFQLQSHSSLAPTRLIEDQDGAQAAFDHEVDDPLLREKYDLGLVDAYASLEHQFADVRQIPRGRPTQSLRSLIDTIQGSIQQPIDLTNDDKPADPMEALQAVPRRYLEFSEDVRPPYFGTYTKIQSPGKTRKLSRNPFCRARKDTDYDYDSEAEWEEPEEGEDILDDEEDEADSVGDANEMDEFLDDEDDALKNKRKMITGDLVPTSTGVCWENESGKFLPSIEGSSPVKTMRGMRMGVLLPGFTGGTIDPFSTAYWESDQKLAPLPSAPTGDAALHPSSAMAPPRVPLQARPNNNGTLDQTFTSTANGPSSSIPSTSATQTPKLTRKPAPKPLSKEDLEEFKVAVVGSQLTKAELMKDLKTRFPKLTNDTIKSTLGDHFAQVGANKADKKWLFVSGT